MLPSIIESLFGQEDVQSLEELCASDINKDRGSAKDMISTMRRIIQAHNNPDETVRDIDVDLLEANNQEEDEDLDEASPPFMLEFIAFLKDLANNSNWAELTDRSLCHRCKDKPDDPWITECKHLYCRECLSYLEFEAAEEGAASRSTCLECDHIFAKSHPCKAIHKLYSRRNSTSATATASKQKKKSQNTNAEWVKLDGKPVLSSKTSAVQAQIEEWLKEDENKKIIVFSQFYKVYVYLCLLIPE